MVKNIKNILKNKNIEHADSTKKVLSCSIGINLKETAYPVDSAALIKTADEALYKAKNNGRDCFILIEN